MTARELALLGASLALVDTDEEALIDLVREIEAVDCASGQLTTHACDIREDGEIEALLDRVLLTHGSVHGLANDVGGFSRRPHADLGTGSNETVIEATLKSCFSMMHQTFMRCMAAHGGVIVNLVSEIWMHQQYSRDLTVASVMMQTLTESAGAEWFSAGVRVNCVAPSLVVPPLDPESPTWTEDRPAAAHDVHTDQASCLADVASAIVWLLSPSASQTTGCSIKVGKIPAPATGTEESHRFNDYPTTRSIH